MIDIGFSEIEIANIVKTFGMAATIIGSLVGGILVKSKGIYISLWVCGFLQMFSNLMFAIQSYYGDSNTILSITIAVENLSGEWVQPL